MHKIFFTPGPSQLYPTVKNHLEQAFEENIGSISHRSNQFEELFSLTVENLRKLMHIPQKHHVFFLGSGTEAMERIIENCVEKESFHFVNGSFSKRFFITAQELKKEPQKIEVEFGEGFSLSTPNNPKIPNSTELICFTHNETSTGVMLPIEPIYQIKRNFPKSLIALDIVSSAPYADLDYSF